ncbi:MAG: hypothetical protein Q7T86_15720 [Hyphomicrobiaceae bacterium]|jgi:hypothetical protein|nr:hypothetical protein [Hyphomicrobiaceae bacterium]
MRTVSRLFDSYELARQAVADLKADGIPESDISLVSNNVDKRHDSDADGVDDRAEGAGTGAGVGATLGGAAGLLTGLGMLAIPGVGPVVAAGWLATTALGALAGGAAGGVIGALTQAGVDEEDAHVYAEGVRRGGTLVTVRAEEDVAARADTILGRSGVVASARRDAYRESGWSRFDETADPLSQEEIDKERNRYSI